MSSIKTTLVSLENSTFHKYDTREKIAYKEKFSKNPNIMVGYGYIRQLNGTNSIFKNAFVINYLSGTPKLSQSPMTFYRKMMLNHYLSWRI